VSDDDYERGRASARLDVGDDRHRENLERFKALDVKQDETNAKIDQLVEAMTLVKGGYRMLLAVGSVGATIGAAVSSAFHLLAGKH
jgi:hypothetical protein